MIVIIILLVLAGVVYLIMNSSAQNTTTPNVVNVLPTSMRPITTMIPQQIMPTTMIPQQIMPTTMIPQQIMPTTMMPTTMMPQQTIDCTVSNWSNWSNCSDNCSGTQNRTRTIMTRAQNGGTVCPALTETQACNTDCLYLFKTHTFTTGGQTGRLGPVLAQLRNAYSGVNWAQNSEFLNMTTQGIQEWKVPVTGSYTIIAKGASGGNPGSFGRGRVVSVNVKLTKGEILKILVGQQGIKSPRSSNAGGGGGTFVVRDTQTPIIVAGGGGGRSESWNYEFQNSNAAGSNTPGNTGGNGSVKNNGKGGTNGDGGGSSIHQAGGGGGLIGNGGNSSDGSLGGLSFVNGGVGGIETNYNSAYGGFGGGGSSGAGGGGGGGYSGGGGGYDPVWASGGGGSSYIIPSMSSDDGATNVGDGSVTITLNQ